MKHLVELKTPMQEREQGLRDLDMIRFFCQVQNGWKEKDALDFLTKYLCCDKAEIRERSLLLEQLDEKSSFAEMEALGQWLSALPEEKRKYDQSSDRVHQLLYLSRRTSFYQQAIEKLAELGKKDFTSSRFQELCQQAETIRQSAAYQDAVQALKKQQELLAFPHTVRVGINLQQGARGQDMSVLSASEEKADQNPLVAPKDPSAPANGFLAAMNYSRTQFGTHFEEYLSSALEKEWKGKLSKAQELWKKIELPEEEALASLAEDVAFYVLGLRLIHQLREKSAPLCRPQITQEQLMEGQDLYYPELAIRGDHIQGNPAALLRNGVVLITGANHSGKTSYLKTLGQNLLLAQLGYFALGESFSFAPVSQIYTLFSAGEDEAMHASRMGIEARILNEMMEKAGPGDLVLINEPLTSTNPVEAIAICCDLLKTLMKKQAPCLMVTHLYDIYYMLHSMLDPEMLSRLRSLITVSDFVPGQGMAYSYTLLESEPLGNSYARETADTFGITLEEMIRDTSLLSESRRFCSREESRAVTLSHAEGRSE